MITRIAIKNFKSLDVDFTLDPVTVLVGKSGTGKSNLVQALRWLRDTLAKGNVVVPPGLFTVTGDIRGQMNFRVDFSIDGIDETYQYFLSSHRNTHSRLEEKLSLGDHVYFHVVEANQWKTKPPVAVMPDAGDLLLPQLYGIQEVSAAHVALTTGIGCYDFPGTVCTSAGYQSNQGTDLDDLGTNYLRVFNGIKKDLSRMQAWNEINRRLQTLNATIRIADIADSMMIVSHVFADKKVHLFHAEAESEGFRRFFAHLLALYQSPFKQTLVFEEPEKGIHPGALATLANAMKFCPQDGRGQVLLTSHSPELLNHFPVESLRVVEIRDGITRIGAVEQAQFEAVREGLMETGELLTADPARLQPV